MAMAEGSKRNEGGTKGFSYSAGPPWMIDFAIPFVFGLAVLCVAALIGFDLSWSGPLLVDALLLAVVVGLGYWSLWRVAYRLQYINGQLRCQSRFSSWSFPLADVVRFRPASLDIGFEIIETQSHPRHVQVCVSKGLEAFARSIARERPGIEVQVGWVSRMLERMPWPSSFREL